MGAIDNVHTSKWTSQCSCGKKYTAERWRGLRLVGLYPDEPDDALEMRVCVCGSTISTRLGSLSLSPAT